ncbi:MAG: hypothetical protein K0S12_1504 [Bacteroidetes bacterium]|jgi:hypothetical protein|nr:hypothetical protein [Bacteroidota bacterium]
MKQLFTLSFCLAFTILLSQSPLTQVPDTLKAMPKDTSWKLPGLFSVSASQTQLSDWQGGGQNNIALISIFKFDPTYRKGKAEWVNKIDLQYGLIKPGEQQYRKNVDQFFALTKYNIKAFNKYWFYTSQADFRTQFAPGFNYKGDSIVGRATSDFMSPGYIQLAVGIDFRLGDYFTTTFAPASGKITYVGRQHLADEGAFGVEKAVVDTAGNIVTPGKRIRYEFGGRVIVKFKKDITKNLAVDSYLDLFSNYSNNPQNIDVVFNNSFTIKITKYFTASFISQMLYDDDITIKRDWNNDGSYEGEGDIFGPRVQILSTIAIGFGITF